MNGSVTLAAASMSGETTVEAAPRASATAPEPRKSRVSNVTEVTTRRNKTRVRPMRDVRRDETTVTGLQI